MSLARLARLRRRARLVLTIEALAVAALWPAGAIALFLIACLLGLGGWQADLAGLAALVLALREARRRYRRPAPAAIDRRIERDSHLPHRPIDALLDRPALIGPEAGPLWQAHRRRLERAIAGARVAWPSPDLAAHDPFALRMLLLLALLAAWIAAGPDAGPRLAASLRMPAPFSTAGLGVRAWITPPRWTGRPPALLDPSQQPIEALAGSTLSLIVTGAGSGAPAANLDGHGLHFTAIGTGSYRANQRLGRSTTLAIGPFWHRIARYRIEVIAPTPPQIGFAAPPAPDADGRRVDLAWTGSSRYGLARLALGMTPAGAPDARTDEVALPAHPRGEDIGGTAKLDLRSSPFAGMAVQGVLAATNRNDQTARSAPAAFSLPAPFLHNATAIALEAIRRDLALNRTPWVALRQKLQTLAANPPGHVTPDTAAAMAKFAGRLGPHAPAFAPTEAALWDLVQRAELGASYRTARALAAARAALEQALTRALAGHQLDEAQLAHLLARLDAALAAHLAAEGHPATAAPGEKIAENEIDRLARAIAHDIATGKTEAARRDMARLRQLLSRLQSARAETPAERARREAAGAAGQRLSQIMQGEADLLDRTARQARQAGKAGQPAGGEHLAGRQQDLEQQLAAAIRAMAAAGLKPSPQAGQGQAAMAGAAGRLQQGDMAGAMPGERASIKALQQAEAGLQAQAGSGSGSGGQPGGISGLGSQAEGGEGVFGNQSRSTLRLGRAGARSDARRIQDELIRRDAEPGLPPSAHSYYRGLLGDGF